MQGWNGFKGDLWKTEINVRDFIQENYLPYEGDESFLEGPTDATSKLWDDVLELIKEETENDGALELEKEIASSITAYKPGYIDKDLEKIVGLQTDKPLKRGLFPRSGLPSLEKSMTSYGYEVPVKLKEIYSNHRKTHNEAVSDAYTPEIKKAVKNGIITGLADSYGRGQHIGDYRRVPLYGVDFIIEQKVNDLVILETSEMIPEIIQKREEVSEQIKALEEFKLMCKSYGFDVSKPAVNALEAVQFLYFAILAAARQNDGVTTSLGRSSTFIDI